MKKLYLAWLICLMAFQVSAQQRWVTGVVADTNGVPVVGATVTVKGGTNGAITNSDGSFRIEASDSDILVFKYLGYDEQEIQVGPRTRIEIELRESTHQLDDVVVTGYQTISKERATGSFDIIDKAQLEKPSGSIASRLIGSAAGLVGTQDAYGNPVFEIRGRSSLSTSATEPLLVVDGFAIEGGFESINPNDVESVTVLKDAAAASIWGAKSANGVIVVTTKNARSEGGGKASVTVDYIIGKTKCDEIKNEMRPSWRKAWSKRNATKISHTRKNTVRTTTKRCSNGIFLSQKQRSLRSLLVIANHPLLLSTTTQFRGTDGPLDAVDDPPVALGVSVDHIERKHRQHKLSLHCLE